MKCCISMEKTYFVYSLVSVYEVSNCVKQQRKTVESFSDQVVPIHTTPIQ